MQGNDHPTLRVGRERSGRAGVPRTIARCGLLLGLLGCAHAPPPEPAGPPLPTDQEVLLRAQAIDAARLEGKLESLRSQTLQLLAERPDDPGVNFLAGRVQPEVNAAFTHHERALALAPAGYWGNLGTAEAYLEMGILTRANERLQRARAARGDIGYAHVVQGEIFRKQGKPTEAIAAFREALQRDEASYPAHRALGELLLQTGDRAGARQALGRAAELAHRDQELQLLLAELLLTDGLLQEALPVFARVTQHNPNQVRAWYGKATAARALGRTDEAIQDLEKVLELQSTHPQARRELAELLRAKGDCTRAQPLYRELTSAAADDLEAWRGLARCADAQGQVGSTLAAYQEVLRLQPADAPALARVRELLETIGARREPVTGRNLQQVFDRILVAVQGCHQRIYGTDPRIRPKTKVSISTEVTLEPGGRVGRVRVLAESGATPEMRECAVWTIRTATFPTSQGATVTFPIDLPLPL